ncbi:hypothetical protein HYV73_01030 [Candidatus Uhrbacteria bacterium]|nr:hypothetical protein [Candidatus Uhrbacteria bacterium]
METLGGGFATPPVPQNSRILKPEVDPQRLDESVRTICNATQLRLLETSSFSSVLSRAEWQHLLQVCGAVTVQGGLKIDLARVISYPRLLDMLAMYLAKQYERAAGPAKLKAPNVVLSSAYTSVPFGMAFAKHVGATFVHTETGGLGTKRERQRWTGRYQISPNETVLQVESLVVSGRKRRQVRDAVQAKLKGKVAFLPYEVVFVNQRPPSDAQSEPIQITGLDLYV